jgi:hypothetical protein
VSFSKFPFGGQDCKYIGSPVPLFVTAWLKAVAL